MLIRSRAAGLGDVQCDPFWTEISGACSDAFGRFISPVTGEPIDSPVPQPSISPAIPQVPPLVIILGGVALVGLLSQQAAKRSARKRAKAQYLRELAEIEEKYSVAGAARRAGKSIRSTRKRIARVGKRYSRQLPAIA